MANPTYKRIIILETPAAAKRIDEAISLELKRPGSNDLERLPTRHAEAECGRFHQTFGGFSMSPGTTAAAFRFERSLADPVGCAAAHINEGANLAFYFIDPNG